MIFYSDEPGFIGDCQDPPGISVPTVVRDLLRDPYFICKSGSVRLGIEPRRLIAEEVPDFVEALQDSARECPLVFISPLPGTEWVSLAIAQARVAEAVAANAVVYYGDSASVMAKMGDLLPEGYKVYGGALRIFMPKVDFQDPADQYRHRYISAAQVKERGQDGVLGILRRALAQDIRFFESKKFVRVETVETERRNDSHRLRLAQLNEKTERLQASEGDTQDALEMVETEEEKRLEAELELSLCQDELQELKGRLSVALSRIDAEEAFHRQARDKLVALDFIRNRLRDYPGEADSVGLFFEAVFKDQLAFTDRGRRSLVDCTTDPAVLWRALWVISHTVYDAYAQGLSVDDAVNNSTNFQYAHTEGKQTKKDQKLMDLRKDTFEGREIDISAHLKIGNKDNDPKSIRIYHCFDAESQKIVIGFCGGHLENYSSRKIK
ncbi:MAG: hypothetical protein LBN10_06410 [Propionibacteriaceae bacterium]|nr:hypothetical protein [Propionibacteriaceae bacterium]